MLLMGAMALVGCSNPSIYIRSNTDENYLIDKKSKIGFYDYEEETIEYKRTISVLRNEMIRMGFSIVPINKADYGLFMSTSTYLSSYSGALPVSTTSYHSGSVGGTPYSGTSSGMSFIPYTRHTSNRIIVLLLKDLNRLRKEGTSINVWEGGMVGDRDSFQEMPEEFFHTLLQYFGTNFDDKVSIQKDKYRDKDKTRLK